MVPSLGIGIHISPPPLRLAHLLERIGDGLFLLRLELRLQFPSFAWSLRASLERVRNSSEHT
jgi:hypothetical protein